MLVSVECCEVENCSAIIVDAPQNVFSNLVGDYGFIAQFLQVILIWASAYPFNRFLGVSLMQVEVAILHHDFLVLFSVKWSVE